MIWQLVKRDSGWRNALICVSAQLPASLPAVAVAAVLPVALLWWTAARLFRGVEIPPTAVTVPGL